LNFLLDIIQFFAVRYLCHYLAHYFIIAGHILVPEKYFGIGGWRVRFSQVIETGFATSTKYNDE
jgi:hypothetical protein